MRISELSERADLPVGTIKFYLRTKLLHQGVLVSATQAEYDESHLARLRLIRALLEVGQLSHAEIQAVLGALARPSDEHLDAMVKVSDASARVMRQPPSDTSAAAEFVERLGWTVEAHSPHLAWLARAIDALDALGMPPGHERMAKYGRAAMTAAEDDMAWVLGAARDETVLRAVGSAVLWGQVLAALRMLAGEHLSRQRVEHPPALVRPRRPQVQRADPAPGLA